MLGGCPLASEHRSNASKTTTSSDSSAAISTHGTAPASNELPDPSAPKSNEGKKKQRWPPIAEEGPYATDSEPTHGLSTIVVSSNIPKSGPECKWNKKKQNNCIKTKEDQMSINTWYQNEKK